MKRTDDEPDLFRKYLLHDLGESEQEEVELRLMTDKKFRGRLAMAQDDLIDDFVAGRLTGGESESFRRHFLTTPARVDKLSFAAALDRYVTAKPENARWFERLAAALSVRPYAVAFTSALALLVLAAALYLVPRTGWLGRDQDLRREFARVNRPVELAATSLSELSRSSAGVVALTLRENVVREDAGHRTAEVEGGTKVVRLLLEVTSGPYDSYRAELQDNDGRELATAEGLKALDDDGAQFVVVQLPAPRLPGGAYRLRLTGLGPGGRATDLGPYPFELSR